jgi:hypothetical protein
VPDVPGDAVAGARLDEGAPDVGDDRVGVGLVGIAQHRGGPSGRRRQDDPVAEVRPVARPGAVVPRLPVHDLDPARAVLREQLRRHAGLQPAFTVCAPSGWPSVSTRPAARP